MNRSPVRVAGTLAAVALTLALLAFPVSPPSEAATFTFSDSSCSSFSLVDNGGGNFTLNCQTSAPGTFSCSVGQSIGAPTLTQAVTLTATCSNATGTVTYTWTPAGTNTAGCPTITQQAANPAKADLSVPTATASVSCGYNLAAVDGAAHQANANRNVSYSSGGSGGGGGGGGGSISCNSMGFASTKVLDIVWGSSVIAYTSDAGGFGANDAMVLRFTTPNITSATGKGTIGAVEFITGGTTPRAAALSPTPCDFTSGMTLYNCAGSRSVSNGDVSISWYISLVAQKSCAATLQANTTYYLNISNFVPTSPTGPQTGVNACALGTCDMRVTFNKPLGS